LELLEADFDVYHDLKLKISGQTIYLSLYNDNSSSNNEEKFASSIKALLFIATIQHGFYSKFSKTKLYAKLHPFAYPSFLSIKRMKILGLFA